MMITNRCFSKLNNCFRHFSVSASVVKELREKSGAG